MNGSRILACLEDVDDSEEVSGLSLSRGDLIGAQADPAKIHNARTAKKVKSKMRFRSKGDQRKVRMRLLMIMKNPQESF